VEVLRGVAVRRIVAATDMTASSTQPKVDPLTPDLQALLAAQGAGHDAGNLVRVRAVFAHRLLERFRLWAARRGQAAMAIANRMTNRFLVDSYTNWRLQRESILNGLGFE